MQSSTFRFSTDDGYQLHVHKWATDEGIPVKGVVLIAHGLAEHSARYRPVAEALTQSGYVVFAHDHRGHGQSCRDASELGFFAEKDGWNRVVQDLQLLSEHVRAAYPEQPFFLLGHSMGSFMAQTLMFRHGRLPNGKNAFSGVVLSGSNGKVGPLRTIGVAITHAEVFRLGPRGRSQLVHQMSFGEFNKPFKPARTELDWLSRDPATVDAYIADPHCGFVATVSLWNQFLKGLGELERPSNLALIPKDLPIYVFSGKEDPVSKACRGLEQLLDVYQEQGIRDVTWHFYPGGRHEALNETNREEVFRDLIHWLDRHLTLHPV